MLQMIAALPSAGDQASKAGSFDDEAGSQEKYRRSRLENDIFAYCVPARENCQLRRWDRIAVSFRLALAFAEDLVFMRSLIRILKER
jgi:hypothetical protein